MKALFCSLALLASGMVVTTYDRLREPTPLQVIGATESEAASEVFVVRGAVARRALAETVCAGIGAASDAAARALCAEYISETGVTQRARALPCANGIRIARCPET